LMWCFYELLQSAIKGHSTSDADRPFKTGCRLLTNAYPMAGPLRLPTVHQPRFT
jgi:hypothetical protein